MTDAEIALAALDKKADRIIEELGLDPEGPPEQFTYETGFQLGQRFASLLPVKQEVFDAVAFEILDSFLSMFPMNTDPETEEFQAYFWAPFISKLLTGRGLTVPQLATIARVTPEHVYRLQRNGLSILYKQEEPTPRIGVNRRYIGLDGRQVHLTVDHRGIVTRPWPGPAAAFQPFVTGLLSGLTACLDTPQIRAQIEPRVQLALSKVLCDPAMGDLFDGVTDAVQRVATSIRDSVPMMISERDESTKFIVAVADLRTHKHEFLAELSEAAKRTPSPPDGGKP